MRRELFFGPALPNDDTLERYMANFQVDSVTGLDLVDCTKTLPSLEAREDTGIARWFEDKVDHFPVFVMGARDDFLVSAGAITCMRSPLKL